jgi:methyl-accepting chemotaxis protein
VSAENQKLLLEYSQAFENTRFYFDRIQKVAARLEEDKDGMARDVLPVHEKFKTIEENTARIGEGLARFAEAAEKVNLLALNIGIESARADGGGAGFAAIANEIRRLAADAAEHARETARISAATRELYADSRQRLLGTERYFADMGATFQEVQADTARLDEVKDRGFAVDQSLTRNNLRLSRLINDIGLALSELEQTNRFILKKIDEIIVDSGDFGDRPAHDARLSAEHLMTREKE